MALAWASLGGCGALEVAPPGSSPLATSSDVVSRAQAAGVAPCARTRSGGPLGIGATQGSAVALALDGTRLLAYVADADERAIHLVDVDDERWLSVTPLPGSPSQLLALSDGRVVAALRDRNEIWMLEPSSELGALRPSCSATTASEPVALAASDDERAVYVASGWGREVAGFSADGLERRFRAALTDEPRAILVDEARHRILATHLTDGHLSAIAIDETSPVASRIDVQLVQPAAAAIGVSEPRGTRASTQGFALAAVTLGAGVERIAVPLVSVNPSPSRKQGFTSGYGTTDAWFEPPAAVPFVAMVDPRRDRLVTSRLDAEDSGREVPTRGRCMLPRAAAAYDRHKLLIACAGDATVMELDARAVHPERALLRRFETPKGPTAVAVGPDSRRAVVLAELAHEVAILDLASAPAGRAVTRVALARRTADAVDARYLLGREIFHASRDARISRDGRSCASCHPDGRSDGLTWSTPDGPRQSIMLAGRIDEHGPFGWFGKNGTLEAHVMETFGRLGGTGFHSERDRRDLEALVRYVRHMPAPTPQARDAARAALARRGAVLFHDETQGCGRCHAGGDRDGLRHDVKSGDPVEASLSFGTPSLRYVSGTAPYFHDGRYATLRELLESVDGTMGHTLHLSEPDLLAIEAYLERL